MNSFARCKHGSTSAHSRTSRAELLEYRGVNIRVQLLGQSAEASLDGRRFGKGFDAQDLIVASCESTTGTQSDARAAFVQHPRSQEGSNSCTWSLSASNTGALCVVDSPTGSVLDLEAF